MSSEEGFNDADLAFLGALDMGSDSESETGDEVGFFKGAAEEDVKDLYLNKEEALDYLLILMQ